jgi:uncharacterized membrane protein YccC
MKYDYTSLLISATLLIGVAVATDGLTTPAGRFVNGVLIGMSIACSLIGLVLYVSSKKR